MKVSTNPPSATIFAGKAMPPPFQQIQGGHRSFAQLLRGPNGGRESNATMKVETGANHFAVETRIGEDAVRFDARPIVAPTADAKPAAPANARHSLAAKADAAEAPTPAQAELEKLVEQLARHLPSIAGHFTKEYGPALQSTGPGGPRQIGPTTGTAAECTPLQMGRTPGQSTANTADVVATKPTSTPPPAQTSAVAARVSALPREIVIVLRGVSLSAKDRETLADIVRHELAPHRLGERMIRIIGAGGKA